MFSVEGVFWISGALLLVIVAVISIVDLRTLTIPNGLNLALAATGIAYQAFTPGSTPLWPLIGGVALALSFYIVRQIYLLKSGEIGLGMGDVKMAGASAVWLHPANLPMFVFLASLTALLCLVVVRCIDGRFGATGRVPFGPFLGIGLLVSWLLESLFNFGFLIT